MALIFSITLPSKLLIVMLLLLPETRGRGIAGLDAEAPAATPYPSRAAVGRS